MILHHRLLATTFLKAPKVVKGQKPKKPNRNINGPAQLYFRRVPGFEDPAPGIIEKVRRGMRLICYDTD